MRLSCTGPEGSPRDPAVIKKEALQDGGENKQKTNRAYETTSSQFTSTSTTNLLCDHGQMLNLSVPQFPNLQSWDSMIVSQCHRGDH